MRISDYAPLYALLILLAGVFAALSIVWLVYRLLSF
jgi:hypothetical protein